MSDMFRLRPGQMLDIFEVLHPEAVRRVQLGTGCYLFIVDEVRVKKLMHTVGAGGFSITDFLNNTFENYFYAIDALPGDDPFLE